MEFERQLAYKRENGIQIGIEEGRKKGRTEKALEDAILLITKYKVEPEQAAQDMKVDLNELLKKREENTK